MTGMNHDVPDNSTFERLARASVENLPAPFRAELGDVVFKVEEFATREQLASVGLDDPWELSGLYHGVSIDNRSVWDSGTLPSLIYLFRQPLIAEWRAEACDLGELVNHVIVHEIAHHFGFSDDDIHAIEDGAG